MNYVKECTVFLVICTSTIWGDSFSTVYNDPLSSLRLTLKKFSKSRHHDTNPVEKEKARRFIKNSFQEFGLYVWTEYFVLDPSLPCGENIVGMLRGETSGTADDKIVIVGAHYDTTRKTRGVDDNGSGLTALLEVAKQIERAGCRPQHTVMFVAFDFEEDVIVDKLPLPFGSRFFVRNLTRYLETTGGTVEGALILEMVANHNNSKDSQLFPRGFKYVCPKAYEEVEEDGRRGNFLAVIGRSESDQLLLSSIKKHYENDSDYRVQPVPFSLLGRPRKSFNHGYLRHFYRSDHYSFWENTVSFKAVMLTDTSNFRRIMDKCYHKKCDSMKRIKKNDLEFLRRNINAVIQTTLELSKADFCNSFNAAMSVIFNVVLLLTSITSTLVFIN